MTSIGKLQAHNSKYKYSRILVLKGPNFVIGNKYCELFYLKDRLTLFISRKVCERYPDLNGHHCLSVLSSTNDISRKKVAISASNSNDHMVAFPETSDFRMQQWCFLRTFRFVTPNILKDLHSRVRIFLGGGKKAVIFTALSRIVLSEADFPLPTKSTQQWVQDSCSVEPLPWCSLRHWQFYPPLLLYREWKYMINKANNILVWLGKWVLPNNLWKGLKDHKGVQITLWELVASWVRAWLRSWLPAFESSSCCLWAVSLWEVIRPFRDCILCVKWVSY